MQATFFMFVMCLIVTPIVGRAVDIYPGTDIQRIVDSNPPGTTYVLKSGVHRRQSVTPKDSDYFVGEPGTVLNGAIELTSFQSQDGLWFITGQVPRGVNTRYPECEPGYDGCGWSEDLFFDDAPLQHVTSIDRLAPGKWYFDRSGQIIYLLDNPIGHRVERSVTPYAFFSEARNVTVQGLLIEKYAAPAAMGAIQAMGPDWTIQGNEIRWSHGAGLISYGFKVQVLGNKIHHNGQIGLISDLGDGSLFEDNEIAFNNYARFTFTSDNAGAGGTKFAKTNNLVVRGNFVHNNGGPGLWTDTMNRNTLYENNIVTDNEAFGIFHEISWETVIRNNISKRNGRFPDPVWNAQIFISNSSNGDIYGNEVEVDASVGHGIILFQDYRPGFDTTGNYVHHNTVTYLGASGVERGAGLSGASHYRNPDPLYNGNNRFDFNHYYVARPDEMYWMWNQPMSWNSFRAAYEPNGSLN